MIEVKNVSRIYEHKTVINEINLTIQDGCMFGIVGSNGSGKSILLKMMAGILRPDSGEILVDGEPVYQNHELKKKIFYVTSLPFDDKTDHAVDVQRYYSSQYPGFQKEEFYDYLINFKLDKKQKLGTYSNGMKKQLSLICGICSGAKYLLLDETIDGLDAVTRQWIRRVLKKEIRERGLTPVMISQNLRKIEEICDAVAFLHEGKVLLSKNLEEIKSNIQKVQCVFKTSEDEAKIISVLDIVKNEKRGSLNIFTVRGNRAEILDVFATVNTIFLDSVPLHLEEIFIREAEAVGYDVKRLMLGYLHE